MTTPARKRFSLAEQLRNELEIETTPSSGVFSESPVPLDIFIKDKKFLGNPELSDLQFQAVRHIEQIYMPDLYPLLVEEFGEAWSPVRFVNYITLMWGKGSGKDHVCRMAAARVAYLLECLASPQEYFGLAPQDDIHALNVAQNGPQARRAYFKPLGTILKNSPWFKDKLKSEITDMATSIRLDKQIELVSGHSLAESFEGLNLILAVADEISGFQSDEEKGAKGIRESSRSAESIMSVLKTSASTRFPENFKAVAISYPRYLHDPIMNLMDEGRKDIEHMGKENSRYYVDGPHSTWIVNPRYKKYGTIKVAGIKEEIPNVPVFITDYRNDPLMAMSKYQCMPQRASNRFFRNDSAISSAFPVQPEGWIEPLAIDYYWGVDEEGAKAEGSYELATVPGWQVNYTFGPQLVPMEGAIYTLHADLGIKSDRAGIAMCHVKNWERREFQKGSTVAAPTPETDYQIDDRPVIEVDFATAYEADLQAKTPDEETRAREIQIRWFRNLVRELRRRGFNIGLVTFDNFQSTDSIQILEMWGIPSDLQSMDRNAIPYNTLREVMYDGRLKGYHHELLIEEIESLSLLPNGKIDHPPGSSKDIADAVCGATCNAILSGGDEGEDPMMVDVATGVGYEVFGQLGGHDDFWGSMDFKLSHEDISLTFK